MAVRRAFGLAAALAVAAIPGAAVGGAAMLASAAAPVPAWVTLGTMGGPMPFAGRSQPANALVWPDKVWLIDCGDGAVSQLAKAGQPPRAVSALFLSHLHFDHTGGVAALIGLRYQLSVPGKLAIYGPPGTKALVEGIVASMRPAAEAGFGLPGAPTVDPASTVVVRELADGEALTIDGARIRAVQNTHYSFAPGSDDDKRFKSFSYRFDLADRSIVYTGDTGPSAALEKLGKGADLLVSELIDVEATVGAVRRISPDLAGPQLEGLRRHLTFHHLSPEQVGDMAAKMRARKVVVTHLAGPTGMPDKAAGYAAAIAARSQTEVVIASDLDRF